MKAAHHAKEFLCFVGTPRLIWPWCLPRTVHTTQLRNTAVFMICTEFEEAIFPISIGWHQVWTTRIYNLWLDFFGVMKLNYRFQTNNTLIMKSPQILKASLTRLASATWDPKRMVGERSLETQVAVQKSGENSGIFQRPKRWLRYGLVAATAGHPLGPSTMNYCSWEKASGCCFHHFIWFQLYFGILASPLHLFGSIAESFHETRPEPDLQSAHAPARPGHTGKGWRKGATLELTTNLNMPELAETRFEAKSGTGAGRGTGRACTRNRETMENHDQIMETFLKLKCHLYSVRWGRMEAQVADP